MNAHTPILPVVTGHLHCVSCDALRDVERAFCENCSEATESYRLTCERNDEGQVWLSNGSGDYLGVVRTPVLMGFVRAPCGCITLGEAA